MLGWGSVQPVVPPALEWSVAISQVAGAGATLAAVVVALWIAVRDGRRVQALQDDRDAGQARLITFEVYTRGDRWRVGTMNHSAAPIFEVTVTKVTCGDRIGRVVEVPGSPEQLAMVPPGDKPEQTTDIAVVEADGSHKMIGSCTAHFLDAAGLRWSRTGSDPPQRIKPKTTG